MKRLIVLVLIASFLGSCGIFQKKEVNCKETPNEDCICMDIYQPVCGCNNVTYGNSCAAECMGITDYSPGECPK